MTSAALWVTIVLSALATYGLRAAFLVGDPARPRLPAWLSRGLPYVAPAVLAALVTSSLAAVDDSAMLAIRAVSLAGAALVAWRTESVLASLATGMISVWALTLLFA